jgi:head-tail adaptor
VGVSLNFSSDYLYWNHGEAVTFYSRSNAGGIPPVPVTTALRGTLTEKELAASNGAYTGQDVKWLIPNGLLSGTVPKPGDKLKDAANVEFTILPEGTSYDIADRIWELITRDIVLHFELRDAITIQLPTLTQDAAAGKVKTWADASVNVPARLQPIQGEIFEEREVRGLEIKYACYLEDTAVASADGELGRLKLGTTYYEIEGYTKPTVIGELMEIACRLVP